MNKAKRVLTAMLSATVLMTSSAGALAQGVVEVMPISAPLEVVPISAPLPAEEMPEYNYVSFSGIVQEMNLVDWQDTSWQLVLVSNEEGQLVNFVVAEDTIFVTDSELVKGARVTGFYDANLPIIMIYPLQPKAAVMAVELPEIQSIKIDRFDREMLSFDGELKLNLAEETEVVAADGGNFADSLVDRKLVVVYSFTTKSIPPQTIPDRIIVMNEVAVPAEPVEQDESEASHVTEVVVENVRIDAPVPYVSEDGIVMVPLRAVAEALGYTVGWDEKTGNVTVGIAMTLTVGRDYYTFAKMAPIELGTAPVIVDGRTFVPLHFFRDVMGLNNAYVLEGQVVIANAETMN
jgi:hypothetical protein